jgi:hypothetical protein
MGEAVGEDRVRVRADCGAVHMVPAASDDGLVFTAVDRASRCPDGETIEYTIELRDGADQWTAVAQQTFTPPRLAATASITRVEPNPFNPRVQISYVVGAARDLALGVFDLRGRLVRSLAQGAADAGQHTTAWDGCDAGGAPMPSGTYLIHLETEGRVDTRRISLIR